MKKVLCKNCECWESKGDGSGFCRRNAPRPQAESVEEGKRVSFALVVPSTMSNDCCFEGVEAAP